MFANRIIVFFFAAMLAFAGIANAQDRQALKREDVNKVMKEIFEQHLDRKHMTADLLKNSYKVYMEQFDPERTYLLEQNFDQFSEFDNAQMDKFLQEYDHSNLEEYEAINAMIQKTIIRARQIRKELIDSKETLFQVSAKTKIKDEDLIADKKVPFATNPKELKERIKDQIIQYIGRERKRYGDKIIMDNLGKTLQAFDEYERHFENQYLFVNDDGQPASKEEKENLFVMHVLKSLARSLDSHTSFLDPAEAYDMKIHLEKGFQGIGVVLEQKPDGVAITRFIKDSPAAKSGKIKINDEIVEINGQNVENTSLETLMEMLRGKGDEVKLLLKRSSPLGHQMVPVSLKREKIEVDDERVDIASVNYDGGILGILTLKSFYQGDKGITSEKDMRKAIEELSKRGLLKGLIIDLRENSGGFLTQAVKVAGLYITSGVIVVSKYSNGEEKFYRDMDGKTSFDGPIIVLTSKLTASAAEIVAEALQDYGVALVVGDEHTYGKGTIQSQTITDNAATSYFKVTVGKYYTVSGKTPQKTGVKADIVVPSHYSNELIGEEYLDNALTKDSILPSYNDPLSDVDPNLKAWYIHYYMPTLQKKENIWVEDLHTLKKNSAMRLADQTPQSASKGGKTPPDLQLDEAVNILKDMVQVDQKNHREKITASKK